jgi:hypothetical protein
MEMPSPGRRRPIPSQAIDNRIVVINCGAEVAAALIDWSSQEQIFQLNYRLR